MDISKTPLMSEDAREDAEMERAFKEASEPEISDLLIPSQDLITMHPEPTQWLVEGLIPVGITWITGDSNTFKTFVSMHIMDCMSNGKKVFDQFPTNQGRAIYVDEENGIREMAKRTRIITEDNQIPDAFYLIESGFVADDKHVIGLAAAVRKYGAKILYFDTLRRIIPAGMDENSAGDANAVMRVLIRIRELSGVPDLSFIILHHHRKANKKEGIDSTIRGSTDWTARADCHIVIEADPETNILTIKQVKLRQDQKLLPFSVQVTSEKDPMTKETIQMRFSYMGKPYDDELRKQEEMNQNILGAIRELNGGSITQIIDFLKGRYISIPRRTIQRWVEEARDKGWIEKVGHGGNTKYYPPRNPNEPPEVNTALPV